MGGTQETSAAASRHAWGRGDEAFRQSGASSRVTRAKGLDGLMRSSTCRQISGFRLWSCCRIEQNEGLVDNPGGLFSRDLSFF